MVENHADFTPFLYPRTEMEGQPAGGADSAVPSEIMPQQTSLPRIAIPFPLIVRGRDGAGARFEVRGVLDNLSARDFYLRLDRSVPISGPLLVVMRFSVNPAPATPAPG